MIKSNDEPTAILEQVIENLDDVFSRSRGGKILNDVSMFSGEEETTTIDKEFVMNALYTTRDVDNTVDMPSCECGRYNNFAVLSKMCPSCNTIAKRVRTSDKYLLWFRSFTGQEKFVAPAVWKMVNLLFSKKYDILRWLSDSTFNPDNFIPPHYLGILVNAIGGREYAKLIKYGLANAINLIKYEKSFKLNLGGKEENTKNILTLLEEYKDNIYINHIPLINKTVMLVEKTNMGQYLDSLLPDLKNLVVSFINSNRPNISVEIKGRIMAKTLSDISDFIANFNSNNMGKKPGMLRKNIYGGKSHWTYRGVITPATGKHRVDTIGIPYIVGLVTYRLHILAMLRRKGYVYKDACALIDSSYKQKIDIIADILEEMVREAPHGMKTLLGRNPSISKSSLTRFNIYFHWGQTIILSQLVVRIFNGDFDGDEMNGIPLLDKKTSDLCKTLDHHYSGLDYNEAFKLANFYHFTEPGAITVANYLTDRKAHGKDTIKLTKL